LRIFSVAVVFIVGFLCVFKLFQNPRIYHNTLGKISSNYEYVGDGMRTKVKIPYLEITNENVIQWDGEHYQEIKDYGYKRKAEMGQDYIFAFFPLFPYIWKASNCSAKGIVFLNFLMFTVGLLIMLIVLKKDILSAILVFSLPLTVSFLIPYTEATFFLMGSIALLGYVKNKYWVYFLGMCLAALSRNAFTLILPAILCTEILFLLSERKIKCSLMRFLKAIFPILIGTGILLLIQYAQGSQTLTKFLSVQKYWGHTYSLPNLLELNDWSHESFGINVPILVLIGIALIIYLGVIFLNACKVIKNNNLLFSVNPTNKNDYALIVSLFCCLAALSMVLLTQNGNLHGLSRFILASPYFIIALLVGFDKISLISPKKRIIGLILSILLSFAVFELVPYGAFTFSYMGACLFFMTMGLYLFQDLYAKKQYKLFLLATFILNIIWASYLFNMYLSNGWIFL
jgi:hypothetical protein